MKAGRRVAAWGAGLALLVFVFWAYLRPQTVMALAQQLWNCF